ncbi:MAG: CoA-acylating methylmalonate-semialdehyde dehydrogenase [Verrucomicrobiota bacterium]
MPRLHHYIDGEFVADNSAATQAVFDPAMGAAMKDVPLADKNILDTAAGAAKAAWPQWAATSPLSRARILDQFKTILWERQGDLARSISAEHGKTHSDAMGEVTRGIEVVEFATSAPSFLKGEFSESVGRDIDSHSIRQPLGVVAGITPFNFPAMVPMWMFPIALACGNTFVLKPSERDPSASVLLAEWLTEAGLPNGAFNVVHGGKEAVDAILKNEDIRAVSFVGSTPIARYVHQQATANGKRVQALGGAKNHMVVMPDADIEMAVNSLMGAAFGSAGERCMAVSVAVAVTDAVADELVSRLKPKVEALKIGPASEPETEMGPLITAEHRSKVESYIAAGVECGADAVVDGREFKQARAGFEDGFYLGGTLFDRVQPGMSIYEEEIFGPVLAVVRCETYQDAIELINRHQFANGTALFTRDGDTARAFSKDVEVGMVGINVPIPVPMSFHSFGGWKNSLFGDHAVYGEEGVRFYTRKKVTTTRWPTGLREDPQFTMPTLG